MSEKKVTFNVYNIFNLEFACISHDLEIVLQCTEKSKCVKVVTVLGHLG